LIYVEETFGQIGQRLPEEGQTKTFLAILFVVPSKVVRYQHNISCMAKTCIWLWLYVHVMLSWWI